MSAGFSAAARAGLEALYDDSARQLLADRVDEVLDLLDAGAPFDARLKRHRMHDPKMWRVWIGSHDDHVVVLWDTDDAGRPWVRYIGPDWL